MIIMFNVYIINHNHSKWENQISKNLFAGHSLDTNNNEFGDINILTLIITQYILLLSLRLLVTNNLRI